MTSTTITIILTESSDGTNWYPIILMIVLAIIGLTLKAYGKIDDIMTEIRKEEQEEIKSEVINDLIDDSDSITTEYSTEVAGDQEECSDDDGVYGWCSR